MHLYRGATVLVMLVSACGSQPIKASPPPTRSVPVDAGSELDAPATAAEVPPDAQEYEPSAAPDERPYRKLVLPRALVLAAPTPTPARCLPMQREAPLQTYERNRQRAAIDAAIRERGWTPLRVIVMPEAGNAGGFTRGANDERLLPIATVTGCVAEPPIVAMNAQHEVFRVAWNLDPKQTRTVKFCQNSCYDTCGMAQQVNFGAEVPADAKLDPSKAQKLDVKLDVAVEFGYVQDAGCLKP